MRTGPRAWFLSVQDEVDAKKKFNFWPLLFLGSHALWMNAFVVGPCSAMAGMPLGTPTGLIHNYREAASVLSCRGKLFPGGA
jgi:hypothetical protein